MTLLLTRAEVEPLLDLQQAMELTLDVSRDQAADGVVSIPPRHVWVPGGALRIVSGALLHARRMGVRVGAAAGLGGGLVALLWDSASGELLAIMAYPFGTLRTAATVGVATQLFARTDARVVGMVGSGRNALGLLRAARHVRPVERIRVYSRNPERRSAFAERAEQALGVPVEAVAETAAATRDADIVYVATDALEPVLHAGWLSPGTFVASMGRPGEIDPSVYLGADLIVVGDKTNELGYRDVGQYRHRLLELTEGGQLEWSGVREMWEVVVGRVAARTSPEQTIVFKESQGGTGDVAFAGWVYARARERGLGQEWSAG